MDITSIIRKKCEKKELTPDEIKYFVGKYARGEINDAQAAALISCIYANGITEDEILVLCKAMGESGDTINLNEISSNIVDKHSTGGVGDKATLILMPVMAALDVPVAKISSRGYGISGGTIDKLESIPGFRTDISIDEFIKNIKENNLCIMGQNFNFAPVEQKLYKLRTQLGYTNSLPLIAASLLSLKLAVGCDKLVFDITCGNGTYIKTYDEAKKLAKLLIRLGKRLDKKVACVITNMNEPLGYSIGHNLEMKETIMALNGKMPQDLGDVIEALGGVMMSLVSPNNALDTSAKAIKEVLRNGKALQKFKEMVARQGGDISYIDDPEKFDKARYSIPVFSNDDGTVEKIDTDMVGSIAVFLGAGRMKDELDINRTAGIVLNKKVGDEVKSGEVLAYIHTNDESKLQGATENIRDAFVISNKKVNVKSRVLEIVT